MSSSTMELPVKTGAVGKTSSKKSEKDGAVKREATRSVPDRIGPSPDLRASFVLVNPGPPGDGEFDLTVGGDLFRKNGVVFGLNRSVMHRSESLTVNGGYVVLRDAGDRLVFEHRGKEFSLRVLWPNGVRISRS